MTSLLLGVALVLGQVAGSQSPDRGERQMAFQKIDGDWTVVYAEMGGKNIEGKRFTNVTIKNNVATCRHDDKEMSWRLEFGPHHMIRCAEIGERTVGGAENGAGQGTAGSHTHHGVYIASPEYFCLSLNKGMDKRFAQTTGAREENRAGAPMADRWQMQQSPVGSDFVLILRRAGNATSGSSR